eukprot:g36241.t1
MLRHFEIKIEGLQRFSGAARSHLPKGATRDGGNKCWAQPAMSTTEQLSPSPVPGPEHHELEPISLVQIFEPDIYLSVFEEVTKKIDEGRTADIFDTDFSEAFEEVPCGRLVSKSQIDRVVKKAFGMLAFISQHRVQELGCYVAAVQDIGIKVDTSPGLDGIYPRLLREAREEIAGALIKIFVSSLATGEIPEDWRVANVIPLFKKANRDSPGNYGP